MKYSECLPTDEIFTHVDDDGAVTIINASDIARKIALVDMDSVTTPLDPEHGAFIMENRGIEKEHLAKLTPERLNDPVIMADWGDGSQLLVDGHHRYVFALQLQRKFIHAYMCSGRFWRPSIVEPDSLPVGVTLQTIANFAGVS